MTSITNISITCSKYDCDQASIFTHRALTTLAYMGPFSDIKVHLITQYFRSYNLGSGDHIPTRSYVFVNVKGRCIKEMS